MDPSGLGIGDVSKLTDIECKTIIQGNTLVKFRELFADPRSPMYGLEPTDPRIKMTSIFADLAESGEYDVDSDSCPKMEALGALVPEDCPLDSDCKNPRCPMLHKNGRKAQ